MADDLHELNPKKLIFYDLDQESLKHYEKDIFEKVAADF